MHVERVAFNAVTKQAILAALAEPRQIDGPLVEAYLARRALDYLVGFTLSPVLWRKLPGAKSAGRVQSVALRLVCDREAEIEAFRTDEYWSIEATMATSKGEEFPARLQAIAGTALKKLDIKDEASAFAIKPPSKRANSSVVSVEKKPTSSATLMRRSRHRRCRWTPRASSASRPSRPCRWPSGSMKASISAARPSASSPICERTVSPSFPKRSTPFAASSPASTRRVTSRLSCANTKPKPRTPRRRTRPSARRTSARKPSEVSRYLEKDQARLYELIWKRAVASQMASAEFEADDGRHRGQGPRRQNLHDARQRLGGAVRRLPQGLRGRPRRESARRSRRAKRITPRRTTRTAGFPSSPKATR